MTAQDGDVEAPEVSGKISDAEFGNGQDESRESTTEGSAGNASEELSEHSSSDGQLQR